MREVHLIKNALAPSGETICLEVIGGTIAKTGSDSAGAALLDDTILDAKGLTLSPGWIDLQVNGAFGHDFTEEPRAIWEVARGLLDRGVTSFLPTLITAPVEAYERALDVLRRGPPDGAPRARVLGLHLEGPFLAPEKKGAHDDEHLLGPEAVLGAPLPHWLTAPSVRMVTLAPELPGAIHLIRLLAEKGKVVSAGHSVASFDVAKAAFDAGVTTGTHLFNAMSGLHHRHPGLAAALLTDPRVQAGLIGDGIHVHPAMLRLAMEHLLPDRLVLVSDAMAAAGMPPGRHTLAGRTVIVDDTSARLEDGTLAGCPLLLDDVFRSVRHLVPELPLTDLLLAVTANPARLLNLTQGRLDSGSPADLVLLDGDGRARYVMIDGRLCKEPD